MPASAGGIARDWIWKGLVMPRASSAAANVRAHAERGERVLRHTTPGFGGTARDLRPSSPRGVERSGSHWPTPLADHVENRSSRPGRRCGARHEAMSVRDMSWCQARGHVRSRHVRLRGGRRAAPVGSAHGPDLVRARRSRTLVPRSRTHLRLRADGARARRDDDPLVRDGRRLRPAARAARRAARRRSRPRLRDDRRAPGLRLLLRRAARAAAGPRARRGADLRPAAQAAALARRRGRARSRWTRRGSIPTRSRRSSRRPGDISFLYTIPTFQNPSGRTLGEERRRRIAELAASFDLDVLEDDPYGLVRYEGDAPAGAARARGRRAGHVHVLLLEDRRTRAAGRLVRRPGGAPRPPSTTAPSRPTSRRRCSPRRSCTSCSRAARSSRTSSASAGSFAPSATRCSPRSTARAHGARDLEPPRGRLLPVGRLRRRHRRRRAARPRDGGRRDVRPGLRLLPRRGRRELRRGSRSRTSRPSGSSRASASSPGCSRGLSRKWIRAACRRHAPRCGVLGHANMSTYWRSLRPCLAARAACHPPRPLSGQAPSATGCGCATSAGR